MVDVEEFIWVIWDFMFNEFMIFIVKVCGQVIVVFVFFSKFLVFSIVIEI